MQQNVLLEVLTVDQLVKSFHSLRNLKFRHCMTNEVPLGCALSQLNPVHTPYSFNIYFNIILYLVFLNSVFP